jgi:hypothetical protein
MTEPVDEGDTEPEEEYSDYRSRRRWIAILIAVVLLAGLGIGLGVGLSGSSPPPTPEGVPLQNVPDLASPDTTVHGQTVDGFITCRKTMDQGVSYHIHTHVAIFVNGVQKRIPAGVGIVAPRDTVQIGDGIFVDVDPAGCLYWLHVHANDGIIHVEAPHRQAFTLGQFFDVWGQPLSANQVGPAQGPVVIFVNGQRLGGNPRDVPLLDHEDVQLDVGTPVVPFKPLKFTVTGLCSGPSCSAIPTTTVKP